MCVVPRCFRPAGSYAAAKWRRRSVLPHVLVDKFQHNDKVVFVLPGFNARGFLPPGIHEAMWQEIEQAFGFSPRRQHLLHGLKRVLAALHAAGCHRVFLDGSFVTNKTDPNDFDGCWEEADVDPVKLDPVLLDFRAKRAAQRLKYRGEMFPASWVADPISRAVYLDFFQTDRNGDPKGLVAINLDRWQP